MVLYFRIPVSLLMVNQKKVKHTHTHTHTHTPNITYKRQDSQHVPYSDGKTEAQKRDSGFRSWVRKGLMS